MAQNTSPAAMEFHGDVSVGDVDFGDIEQPAE